MIGKTVLALGLQGALANSFNKPEVRLNEDCSPDDLDLAEQCEGLCVNDLMACVDECNDEPCKSDCYRHEIKCVDGRLDFLLLYWANFKLSLSLPYGLLRRLWNLPQRHMQPRQPMRR